MISGLSHTTLSVSDLERSFRFYNELLGLAPVARWYKGAYLLAGQAWICLSLDPDTRSSPLPEYSHLAFSVEQSKFATMVESLQNAGTTSWQENHSHGESFYFLDPDGHKLEIHTSNLRNRLESLRLNPPRDLILFETVID
jgi:catechol 2,3-dioxygenase-like lactoylglutathione lyase family enzyme